MRGSTYTFSGTTLSVQIDAIVSGIVLNGGTFNNYCYFETTSVVPGVGTGGCTFNDSTYFYHNFTGGGVWRLNNGTGNTFNGKVTLRNKSTSEISTGAAGINVFNGNVVLENSSSGGIYLGDDTLRSGSTISVGANGYTAGEFRAPNFYQAGTGDVITLTFTGTALPTLDGATFNGTTTINSNIFLFKKCVFNGTTALTATGSGSSSWSGGNRFYGNVTITNNATAGNLKLDADTANTYYANATFNGSREIRVCYGADVSSFYGNITAASNTTFSAGSGTLRFYGSNNQTVSIANGFYKTKIEKAAGNVTLSTAHNSTNLFAFNKGNLVTTSTNLLSITSTGTVSGASDSSFVDGPVKKVGNTAFVFPTGKGNNYRAVEISAPSASTDAFTCEYISNEQSIGSTMDTSINFISDCNYWNLNRTAGSSNVIVKFMFDSTDCDWRNEATVHISNWNGTKWLDKGVAVTDGSFKKISSSFSSFGSFLFSYKLNTPYLGLLAAYSCFSNDSTITNDTLRINEYGASRMCNNSSTIIQTKNYSNDTLIVNALKKRVDAVQLVLRSLSGANLTSNQINGHTITAGVFNVNGSLNLNDFVILQGDSSSVFVFNITGNLNILNNTAINLDGVLPYNVYFNVDSAINISGTTFLYGLLFAKKNITVSGTCLGKIAFYSLGKIYVGTKITTISPFQLTLNNFALLFTYAACNLTYSQATVDLHMRPSVIGSGIAQPVSLTVAAVTGPILQANLIFTTVTTNAPPLTRTFLFNNNTITATIRKKVDFNSTCWNNGTQVFNYTATYRATIPLNMLNTGSANSLSGLPVCTNGINGEDTDGACLFIIYQNQCGSGTGDEYGFLTADLGLGILNSGNTFDEYISVFTPYTGSSLISTDGFMLIGDLEANLNNPAILNIDGNFVPVTAHMYDFAAVPGINVSGINPLFHGEQYIDVINNINDCINVSLIGVHYLYHSPTKCSDFSISATSENACIGSSTGSIDVTVTPSNPPTGTYTYLWSNGATTQDLSGLVAGTYTVVVKNADGCSHQITVTIIDDNVLNVTIVASDLTPCPNDIVTLTAYPSGADDYSWTGGTTPTNTQSVTAVTNVTATYTVDVTAGGCINTEAVTINYTPQATLSSTATSLCPSQTATLTASPNNASYTYNWSAGAATANPNEVIVTGPGTYTVTIPNGPNGCTLTASYTINATSISPTITPTPIKCNNQNNGSLTASAGTSYVWSPGGATTQTISNLGPGTYTVTVTSNGCTGIASATLSNPPVLSLSISKTNTTCQFGSNGVATVTASGGVTPYSYQWSNGGTSSTINSLATGNYTVTVTDANLCTKTAVVTINYINQAPPAPIIIVTNGSAAACSSVNNYSISNILSGASYSWTATPVNGGTATGNTSSASNLNWDDFNSGTISFTVNNGTCTRTSTYTVQPCCSTTYIVNNMTVTDIINQSTNYFPMYFVSGSIHGFNGGVGFQYPVAINGTLTIDQDFQFEAMDVFLGPQARIVVLNGHRLIISKSRIHGCGIYMWDGIFSAGSTAEVIIDDTRMEDSENGINVVNGALINSVGNTFNRNYKSITIMNNAGTSSSIISRSTFSCSDINSLPVSDLLPPHLNERSLIGIQLNNVQNITVGNVSATHTNYFYNLDVGINSFNSGLTSFYNDFENITFNKYSKGNLPTGYAIYGSSKGSSYSPSVTVGGAGTNQPNNFTNCTFGIGIRGICNSTITHNNFTNMTNVGNGNSQQIRNAVYLNKVSNSTHIVSSNTFNSFITGVNVTDPATSNFTISDNNFNTGTTTGAVGITMNQINVSNTTTSPVTITGNTMNHITNMGIMLLKYTGAHVDHNTINFDAAVPASQVKGISIQNGKDHVVELNIVQRPSGASTVTSAYESLMFGISVEMTGFSHTVASNRLSRLGRGVTYRGTTVQQYLTCNNFDQNWTGVRMMQPSTIGNQVPLLPNGQDQNNDWTPLTNSNRGIVGYATIPSTLWYNLGTAPLAGNQMLQSAVTFTNTPTPATNSCPPSPLRMQQQWLVDLAYDKNYGDSLDADFKYWAKKTVYAQLKADDSLMLQGTAEDTLLHTWYDSVATANIGKLQLIADSAKSNIAFAAELNETFSAANHAEENNKAFNTIYLATWATDSIEIDSVQYETLFAMANEDPITGGEAVYSARAMLGLAINDYDDEGGGSRLAQQTNAANSGSSVVDARISLMPNPATNQTIYKINLNKNETGIIELFTDLSVKIRGHNLMSGNNSITIDLSYLTQGVYFIRTNINDRIKDIRKLVVIK